MGLIDTSRRIAILADPSTMLRALEARLDRLEQRVSSGPAPDRSWTAVSFAANWTNQGGSYAGVAYRRVGAWVEVRGLAKATGATGTFSTVFTLPSWAWPPTQLMFPTIYGDAVAATRIDVQSADGKVVVGANLALNQYVPLNMRWSMDA